MLLNQRQILVKERIGLLKLSDTYDLFDPETQQQSGLAKEEVSALVKGLRLLIPKKLMPTTIRVYETEGGPAVLTLRRNVALFRPTVRVEDGNGREIGSLRSKFFSIGGGFLVFDSNGNQIGEVKGNWIGWDFQVLTAEGRELGKVTKKWAGIGRELFTTADNYMVSATDPSANMGLILAAGLAIDIVLKEQESSKGSSRRSSS